MRSVKAFAAPGAALWAFGYGVLALWWVGGGGGFPFGASDPDPAIAQGMSVLGDVRQESAAPVIAVVAFVGAAVAGYLAVRLRNTTYAARPNPRISRASRAWRTSA